ncbi:MAG: PAS domain S-box-containing protein [Colwellia sp.]|jgi:PAS domain S-box-containing protein
MNIEAQLQSYFNLGLIGMAVTSLEKSWFNVNDKLCEILGYPQEELMKISWAEVTFPDDLKAEETEFERVVAGEIEGYSMDKRFTRKDGIVIHTTISTNCIRNNDGSIDHFVAIIQDISKQKEAEKIRAEHIEHLGTAINEYTVELNKETAKHHKSEDKSQQNESKFYNIIEASPVPYALNDNHQNITYLNRSFIQTFGYTLNDIPTLTDWWSRAYPDYDYRQWVINTWQTRMEQAEGEHRTFIPVELNICCKNGMTKTVIVSAASISESFNDVHMVILYDITERKRAEEALLESDKDYIRIQEHAQFGLWTLDLVNNILTWSDENYRILGVQNEKIITYEKFLEIVHPDDTEYLNTKWMATVNGNDTYDIEHRLLVDGEIKWVRQAATVVSNEDGKAIKAIGITQDITERKKIDKALLDSQRQLHQSQKIEAIGQLTGGIAHDFDNILGIITGYVVLAKQYSIITKDTKQTRYLTNISDATNRAINLVSKMLVFVRKYETTNIVPLYLQSVLKDEYYLFFTGLPSSIKINMTIDNTLPNILLDITEFDQLLVNIVTNACDSMDEVGIIDIRLGWSLIDSTTCSSCQKKLDNNWIELSVTDSGAGIESDLLTRIFDPFYTSKEVGKGTGLGLSVTHGIMHAHGGHIIVESEVSTGTTFRLLFPPHNKEYTKVIIEDEVTPQITIKLHEILVVDDEISLTELMGEYLETFGYKATTVSSSIKALELFKEQPDKFSLVITDQTMPELTGGELIKQIREIRADLPIILNSGYSEYMNTEKAAKLDIMYLQKPINLADVVNLINELLGE